MKDLLLSPLLLYLIVPSISHSVTVQPSNSSDPDSEDVLWPESTNKVAITVQCLKHHSKFSLGQPDQGNVTLCGANGSISQFCKMLVVRGSMLAGVLWWRMVVLPIRSFWTMLRICGINRHTDCRVDTRRSEVDERRGDHYESDMESN